MSSRWTRVMPLSGVVFVALILASIFTDGSSPDEKASAPTVISYYQHHQTSVKVSGLLTLIAVVVGVFFFGVLRGRLRQTEGNEQFASMAFGGAILFGAGGCVGSGIQYTLADVPTRLDPGAAQALNVLSANIDWGLTTVGISALTLTTGIAVLRSGMMPRWLGWFSIVMGVVALAGPIGWFSFIAMGPWVLIVSGLMYRADDKPDVIQLPSVPAQAAAVDAPSLTAKQ